MFITFISNQLPYYGSATIMPIPIPIRNARVINVVTRAILEAAGLSSNACVVTRIDAAVANSSNLASFIGNVACVVIIFLGLFFSFNDEMFGTWFPRDLGVQGEGH